MVKVRRDPPALGLSGAGLVPITLRGAGLLHLYVGPVIISRYRLAITGPSANLRFSSRSSAGQSRWPSCSSLAMVSNSISRGVIDSPSDSDRHYIDIASQGNTSLPGAVMLELQILCVKLPLRSAGSGGNLRANLAFGYHAITHPQSLIRDLLFHCVPGCVPLIMWSADGFRYRRWIYFVCP